MPISEVYNENCMIGMARYPDKYFDLAIVDPPYGINACNDDRFGNQWNGAKVKTKDYKKSDWDKNIPDRKYFNELQRVSKHCIIWGGNFYDLGKTNCYIIWDKINGDNTFADCELAWTNFDTAVRKFEYRWQGMLQQNMLNKEIRIHPTQKPVALYKWLLRNYAKPGDKILDTHLGSQSSRIAAWDGGFDFYGWELDEDYFMDGCKRFDNHIKQLTLQL